MQQRIPAILVPLVVLLVACCLPDSFAATVSVPDDQPTLGAAIAVASAGDTVLVAPGLYTGEGFRDIAWAGKDLVIRSSGGAEVTTLHGNCDTNQEHRCILAEPHRAFIISGGLTDASRLEGFTLRAFVAHDGGALLIEDGSPVIRDCIFIDDGACEHGACARVLAPSSPRFESCSFEDSGVGQFDACYLCWSWGWGGAVSSAGAATFTDCRFTGDGSWGEGGAIQTAAASVTGVSNCTFSGNWSWGRGGAINAVGALTVEYSHFEDNSSSAGGGAIAVDAEGVVSECTFVADASHSGGGVWNAGALDMDHCVFTQCTGMGWAEGFSILMAEGSAVSGAPGSTMILRSCTAWGGANQNEDGAAVSSRGHMSLEGCIIAGSLHGPAVSTFEGGTVSLECCDLWGNAGGDWTPGSAGQLGVNGNITADPLFCDPEAGDFTLEGHSPCLAGLHPSSGGTCMLMGALGHGCGATPVREMTWGRLKFSRTP